MKRLLFVMLSFCIFYTKLNAADQAQAELIHLRWQAVEYASQYEIIVEQQTKENTFVTVVDEIKRNSTEIECSLMPGKYRYQVIVYDMFERDPVSSDWLEFEIKQKIVQTEQEKAPESESPQAPSEEENSEGKKKSFLEISVAAEYAPIVALITGLQSDGTSINFQPASMGLRLSALLYQSGIGKIGVELAPSIALLNADLGPSTMDSVLFGATVNFLYQYMLTNTKSINGRLGAGAAVFYDFYFEGKENGTISYLANYVSFLFAGAVSFQNYFNKTIYIDGGVGYKMLFFSNSLFHFISPFVSLGAKF